MKRYFKRLIKSLLAHLGYEIRPLLSFVPSLDIIHDQKQLLLDVAHPIIIQLGAHVGRYTETLSHIFPSAKIYAFEPNPDIFEQLRSNFDRSQTVKPIPFAVSDRNGVAKFYVTKSPVKHSLLRGITEKTSPVESIEVRTVTIDEFCQQEAIREIHVLSMDIQGGEFHALRGGGGMLASKSIRIIDAEISFLDRYEMQSNFDDILHLLYGAGYSTFRLYAGSTFEPGRPITSLNAVFVRTSLQQSLERNRSWA